MVSRGKKWNVGHSEEQQVLQATEQSWAPSRPAPGVAAVAATSGSVCGMWS